MVEQRQLGLKLAETSGGVPEGGLILPTIPSEKGLARARDLLATYARRNLFFSASVMTSPAWEMLLQVYVSQGQPSVSLLAEQIGTTFPVAGRWARILVSQGLVVFRTDEEELDPRLVMTEEGFRHLESLLA